MQRKPNLDKQAKDMKDLKPSYDRSRAVEIRRSDGFVLCEIYNGTSSILVNIPEYAFDATRIGSFSTVRGIREYIIKHPEPQS